MKIQHTLLYSAMLGMLATASAPLMAASDAEIEQLRKELANAQNAIRQLEAKINQIEKNAAREQANAPPATTEALVVITEEKTSEPNLEVYGFGMVDYVQDFGRVNPAWDSTLRPSRIPTTEGQFGSDGQAILSARQSRLGVNYKLPLGSETLVTKFEFDMFGVGADEGQTTIRLRHAYGEWGPWLAGQTNSLFMDVDLFPNVIDYWGPSGMVFLRNPQIRWTPVKGPFTFAIAIENPGVDVDTSGPDSGSGIQGNETFPDITSQVRFNEDWGHIQLAGILRQLDYENLNTADNKPEGSETGWGLDLTSNIYFGDDTLRLGVVYGEGIATYMNDGGMDMGTERISNEPMGAVPLTGVVAYYDLNWNAHWSTAFGYSYTEVDNERYQAGDAFHKGEYASINLLYTPSTPIMMGVEYLWGQRTDNDGDTGDDNRLQFSMKYSFSSLDF